MNDKQFELLLERLNMLVKLNAAKAIEGKDFGEQVTTLAKIGLQPIEIAEVTGKTANNVRVTMSYLKKKGGKKKND